MNRLCILVVISVIISGIADGKAAVRPNKGDDKKKVYDEIRSLYYKTSPDSMRCWFKWSTVAKKECKAETEQYEKELLQKVTDADKKGILKPIPGSTCTKGFAEYDLGVFEDPVSLPCSEDAFKAPKVSDEESKKTYRDLLKLFYDYDSIFNTKAKADEAGKKLAAAIQAAEQKEILPKKCDEKTGYGFYSLYTGMPLTKMPCKSGVSKFEKPKSEKPLDMKKIQQEIKTGP